MGRGATIPLAASMGLWSTGLRMISPRAETSEHLYPLTPCKLQAAHSSINSWALADGSVPGLAGFCIQKEPVGREPLVLEVKASLCDQAVGDCRVGLGDRRALLVAAMKNRCVNSVTTTKTR